MNDNLFVVDYEERVDDMNPWVCLTKT